MNSIAEQFSGWIGRTFVMEDEIALSAVRRIAAMSDRNPETFRRGDELPANWYSLFFPQNAPQSQIGPDGHPRKGEFQLPVPLPRRMFASRSVEFYRPLTIGADARKVSTISAIEEKRGRSGLLVFVTTENLVQNEGKDALLELQRVVYREAAGAAAAPAGSSKSAPKGATMAPIDGAAWSRRVMIDPVLLFRYSAVTWNAHRIHYDADYTRDEEGYPGLVNNGALMLHLIIEAALDANPGVILRGLEARLSSPLYLGQALTIAAKPPTTASPSAIEAWGADPEGRLVASVSLQVLSGWD
jgi:3-methylfumaryl-CoA hydratase